MEETKLFLITYFAALIGVVPPGLVNMSVAKTCVQHGKKEGIFVAIGATFIVLFQAWIAILLAKYIFDNLYVQNVLLRAGLVIFILMAVYFFIIAQRKKKEVEVQSTTGFKSFIKGMIISALNIFPIPYFCAVGAALNVKGGVDYDLLQMFFFVSAAALGSFTTLYLYAIFFARIEDQSTYFSKYSNYFMAALMLVLVIITLIRIFYEG
ncbi:MAG TPA: LysE family transporter [Salinimicrobium sp.]|nr:LysE family transporter [Salinimicrobium sp.]